MRLPRITKIGPYRFKILYKKKVLVGGKECLGAYDIVNNKILIEKGIEKTRKAEIFLHECLHVIDILFNLKLGEKAINALALLLLAFLRDNNIDWSE